MKSRFAALATLAVLSATPAALADTSAPAAPKEAAVPSVKPEEFAKALLGSWRQEIREGEAKGHTLTTYLEDGTATSSAHFVAGDKELHITAKAKWTLEGDKLKVEITESSMPEMMPAGFKIEQTIVSLSEKEFRYVQSGKEITEKRVKEEDKKAIPAK